VALAGCPHPPEAAHFEDRYFSQASAGSQCRIDADRTHTWKHELLASSLEHASNYSVVLHTVAHAPALDLAAYWPDFDYATAHGIRLATFHDLASGYRGPGWAFSVEGGADDLDTWTRWREQLRLHAVHVTFFVSHLATLTPAQREQLRALAADGHDIEVHAESADEAGSDAAVLAAETLPAPVAISGPFAIAVPPYTWLMMKCD
jgi:hypothetical protein